MYALALLVRALLIILPLTGTALRLHAHVVHAPDAVAQEVNCCLRLVRVAASRRQTGAARSTKSATRSAQSAAPLTPPAAPSA
jgi:hypothetical protein